MLRQIMDGGSNRHEMRSAMKKSVGRTACLLAITASVFIVNHVRFSQLDDEDPSRRLTSEGDNLPPLFPLEPMDYLGFGCAIFGLILAAGGGIGGGGILVPIYILILQFPVKYAIPLSNVTVFGGAVANTILNAKRRHPDADRPLIDWNLMLVMEPLTMAGALVGTNVNKLLPDVVIVVMLVILLTFTAYKTLTKAKLMYDQETREFKAAGLDEDGGDKSAGLLPEMSVKSLQEQLSSDEQIIGTEFTRTPSIEMVENASSGEPTSDVESTRNVAGTSGAGSTDKNEAQEDASVTRTVASDVDAGDRADPDGRLVALLEEERRTPRTCVIAIAILFVITVTLSIFQGGSGVSVIGIACGSFAYFAMSALKLIMLVAFALYARHYLIKLTELKEEVGYQYVDGDIVWDSRSTVTYPSICCVSGTAAGLFGIGGGIINGPLMLAMGIHPAVASATSACMILITSSTATTSYVTYGLLKLDYAVPCALIGFLSTLFGQSVMHVVIAHHKRFSLIAYSIGLVVALSAVCMTIESVLAIMEGGSSDKGGFCS